MSDLLPSADVVECPPGLASAAVLESHPAREAVGSVPVYVGARIPAPLLSPRVQRPV